MDPTAPTRPHLKRSFKNLGGFIVLAFVIFLFPFHAYAASLYISPATKTVSVGQDFTLSAYVSSPDQAMNAASGDISFPSDKLQVLSISKANSVMNLWIRDPSFTNSEAGGDVHFEGVVLNPGFTGAAGNLITITFQAVGTGDAPVTFSSGAVLANDGNGTNILTAMEPGDVTIGPRVIVPIEPPLSTPVVIVATGTVATSTQNATSSMGSSTPALVVGAQNSEPSSGRWKTVLRSIAEWGLVALLGLLLLAAIIFLAINIVHRIRKWRIASGRDLLILEETLRNDLKRIEKELGAEKRSKQDPVRKAVEHVEANIKKDIEEIDELRGK
jgi:hypothetical protein